MSSKPAFRVRVTSNAKALSATIRSSGLTGPAQLRAAVRALNLAATKARTAVAHAIVERYKLKYGDVLALLQIEHASVDRLVVALKVSGRPLSVARFDPRQVKAGVSVNIKGSRKTIKGAFVRALTNKAGDEYSVVFIRVGNARYPLKALKTIDIPGAFSRDDAQQVIEATAVEVFETEFVRQLDLLLR